MKLVVQSDGPSDVTYRNHRDWLPNLYLVQGWQTTMLVMYLKLSDALSKFSFHGASGLKRVGAWLRSHPSRLVWLLG